LTINPDHQTTMILVIHSDDGGIIDLPPPRFGTGETLRAATNAAFSFAASANRVGTRRRATSEHLASGSLMAAAPPRGPYSLDRGRNGVSPARVSGGRRPRRRVLSASVKAWSLYVLWSAYMYMYCGRGQFRHGRSRRTNRLAQGSPPGGSRDGPAKV
jgi:hypothetical protein